MFMKNQFVAVCTMKIYPGGFLRLHPKLGMKWEVILLCILC